MGNQCLGFLIPTTIRNLLGALFSWRSIITSNEITLLCMCMYKYTHTCPAFILSTYKLFPYIFPNNFSAIYFSSHSMVQHFPSSFPSFPSHSTYVLISLFIEVLLNPSGSFLLSWSLQLHQFTYWDHAAIVYLFWITLFSTLPVPLTYQKFSCFWYLQFNRIPLFSCATFSLCIFSEKRFRLFPFSIYCEKFVNECSWTSICGAGNWLWGGIFQGVSWVMWQICL